LSASLVYDEAIWNGPARGHLISANPLIVSAGATILKADGLADLARQLGLPPGALEVTVSQYNAAIAAAQTEKLDPPRTASTVRPHPIRQAPYYAVRVCAGITSTMGGIAIDGVARVLDGKDAPIPGLYAVGCAAGGLEGGPVAGYVGQLAYCSSMALRAANHIASVRG
jgi:fumarate reductase flavoprotein subunit